MNNEINEKQKNDLAPSGKTFKAYVPYITLILITLILAISIYGVLNTFFGGNGSVDNSDLAFSLKPVGNLTTVEVKASKIGVTVDMKVGLCSFGGEYLINGTTEAGIDLTAFSDANVSFNEDKKTYTVNLQEPQLTRCEFTARRYKSWQGVCGDVDNNTLDQIASYVTAKGIIQDVLDGGIVDRSKRETEILMQNIVKTLTGHSAEITFSSPSTTAQLPESCNPEIPRGWEQKIDGTWIPDNSK